MAIAFLAHLPFLMIGNLQFEIDFDLFSAIPANVKQTAARRPPPAQWGFLGKPSCGAADETTKPSVRQLIKATFTLYLQDFLWWAQCVLIVKQLHFVTPALSPEK